MIEQERVERLQAWSRDNDIQRFFRCLTCRDTGTVMAYQRIGGQLIRVTGGCPKCNQVPEGLPRIDLSDPSLVWQHERPEPFIAPPSSPPERPRYADPPLSEEPSESDPIAAANSPEQGEIPFDPEEHKRWVSQQDDWQVR